jgi:dolichyl-phosphate beta-glucosyltransferase
MFSPEVFIAAVITLTITAGLSWLFYPAWVSATADVLEWDEVKVKQGQPQDTPILLSIVVPAYNEEDRIPHMIKSAHHFLVSTKGRDIIRKLSAFAERVGCAADEVHDIEWIVVDDGSSDGTCLVVASLAKALKSIHTWKIISLKNNSGKG